MIAKQEKYQNITHCDYVILEQVLEECKKTYERQDAYSLGLSHAREAIFELK